MRRADYGERWWAGVGVHEAGRFKGRCAGSLGVGARGRAG
jgi:hypothetical protein